MSEGGGPTGSPPVTCRCPLCLVLHRLWRVGHSSQLTEANSRTLVDSLRVTYNLVLDLGVVDAPVVPGPRPVAAGSGPTTWEGRCPSSSATPSASHKQKEEEKKGEKESPEEHKATASEASSPEEDRVEAEELSKEERSASPKASPSGGVNSDLDQDKTKENEESEEEEVKKVPSETKVPKKRKKSKEKKGKRKSRSRSPEPKKTRTREKDSREEENEEEEPEGSPVILRPKSPDYPPSASARKRETRAWKDQIGIIPSARNNPFLKDRKKDPWRSKGLRRQERWKDIQTYGPNAQRKADLERRWKKY